MKKFQLILIFLISYNLIESIKCEPEMPMEALTIASKIGVKTFTKSIPDPIIPKNFVDELIHEYKYGINDDEKIRPEVRHFLNYIVHDHDGTNKSLEILDWDMKRIDEFYVPFNELLKSNKDANLTALENYFNLVLSDQDDGVQYALNQMQYSTRKIFDLLNLKINTVKMCNDNMVLRQQHISNFLSVAINKAYKGYFLIISAYKFLMRKNQEDHRHEINNAVEEAEVQIQRFVDDARSAMFKASRDIRNCNTQYDIKNVTFTEIVGPSQGFVFDSSAVDINSDCHSFNVEYKVIQDSCKSDKSLCFEQSCAADGGVLKNCDTIGGDDIKICPAIDKSKRYLSIETSSDKWGNVIAAKQCPKDIINKKNIVVPHYLGLTHTSSKFCYCHCERKNWKEGDVRVISLQWAKADYLSNKVITSLKFQQENGVISLAAQHGVILPGGFINKKTVQWIEPLEPKLVEIKDGYPEYQYIRNNKRHSITERMLKNEQDFLYITSGLSINLDDITVPPGHVVIGAKLNKSEAVDDKDLDVLELVVLSMEFNIYTGKLDNSQPHHTSATKFMMKKLGHTKRQMINLANARNPITMQGKNDGLSAPHSKLRFRVTDKVKDIGQSIVPFIDIQEINSELPVPLSSVGLYHRGSTGSGGFIGLKFQSYDIKNYFEQVIFDNTVA
ncbi:hypothetical protein HCN44_008638 [Aphidius gifuensis]|uniref:Venom protein n=1 Tax=Aphidius gifuensis TaxID=684658 RepID=A0A834XRJ5_APHGI|nr:uncharacterized protein LOC122858378 [Aphidius gifuensis]KAF7989964.1 hypothetical protein HCN44_008638 [Aphidius gifuensis]